MSQTKIATADTEQELIQRAQTAISQCNWTVGECAAQWTTKFARGRSDGDFGELVGMSNDQIYQRRRVWESFADVRENYAALKWSHFYVALTWDDSAECLSWANENAATIAEMKAWRRLQQGEDVTTTAPTDDESPMFGNDGASTFSGYGSDERSVVRTADDDSELPATRAGSTDAARGKRGATSDAAALSAGEYAPFKSGATKAPQEMPEELPGSQTSLSVEQTVKRLATMLERCAKSITPEVQRQFSKLPEKVRVRFLASMKELNGRADELR